MPRCGDSLYSRNDARVNDPVRLRPRTCSPALLPVPWSRRRLRTTVHEWGMRRRHDGVARCREGVLFRVGPLLAAVELQVRGEFLKRHAGVASPGMELADLIKSESGILHHCALHACEP